MVLNKFQHIDCLPPWTYTGSSISNLYLIKCHSHRKTDFCIFCHFNNIKIVDFDKIYNELVEFSGAEIKAVCTEAGYFAIRNDRTYITQEDFMKAIKKVSEDEELELEYMNMFG